MHTSLSGWVLRNPPLFVFMVEVFLLQKRLTKASRKGAKCNVQEFLFLDWFWILVSRISLNAASSGLFVGISGLYPSRDVSSGICE